MNVVFPHIAYQSRQADKCRDTGRHGIPYYCRPGASMNGCAEVRWPEVDIWNAAHCLISVHLGVLRAGINGRVNRKSCSIQMGHDDTVNARISPKIGL
jgi:hypothetical protein